MLDLKYIHPYHSLKEYEYCLKTCFYLQYILYIYTVYLRSISRCWWCWRVISRFRLQNSFLTLLKQKDSAGNWWTEQFLIIIPLAQWGSSLPGLRKCDPPLSPPTRPAEICNACVCKVNFKHLPQPLQSHTQNFRTLGQLVKITPFVCLNIA